MIKGVMDRMGMSEDEEIKHGLVSRAIEQAQKRVESRNFDIRKHLLEYDDVMNRQREIIYEERRTVLESENLDDHVLEMTEEVVRGMESQFAGGESQEPEEAGKEFLKALSQKFGISFEELQEKEGDSEERVALVMEKLKEVYEEKKNHLTPPVLTFLEKSILLQVIDSKWKDHLRSLDDLREGIGLRAYGQRDPLIEYKREAFDLFEAMTDSIKQEGTEFIFRVDVVKAEKVKSVFEGQQKLIHKEDRAFSGQIAQGEEAGPSKRREEEEPEAPFHREEPKVGRNDPCPCGSGKKYKKCHGA